MNSKTLKIIAIILAVTTVAGIAAFFITRGSGDGGILPDIVKPEEFSFADSKYTTSASLSVKGANGEIYLPTGIDGVYYTAALNGEIAFYEYAGGAFAPSSLEKSRSRQLSPQAMRRSP